MKSAARWKYEVASSLPRGRRGLADHQATHHLGHDICCKLNKQTFKLFNKTCNVNFANSFKIFNMVNVHKIVKLLTLGPPRIGVFLSFSY